jgi:hypothetical protein
MSKAKIVCLCGSTKFKKDFDRVAEEETLKGNIVLTVHVFRHCLSGAKLTEKQCWELDQIHQQKILLSDEVIIINKNKYTGLGTCDEIGFAWAHGKVVKFMEYIPREFTEYVEEGE